MSKSDGLDQAFDNLGKAIKITAGLKGTDKSITEVFKMSDIDDSELFRLASLIGCEPESEERHRKQLKEFIAQQVKEATVNGLIMAKYGTDEDSKEERFIDNLIRQEQK